MKIYQFLDDARCYWCRRPTAAKGHETCNRMIGLLIDSISDQALAELDRAADLMTFLDHEASAGVAL